VRDQLDDQHDARQADAARPSFSGALAITALASMARQAASAVPASDRS
jgi:hypothetical protein